MVVAAAAAGRGLPAALELLRLWCGGGSGRVARSSEQGGGSGNGASSAAPEAGRHRGVTGLAPYRLHFPARPAAVLPPCARGACWEGCQRPIPVRAVHAGGRGRGARREGSRFN